MKKIMTLGIIAVFALAFTIGILTTPTSARPPIPCTYKCINQTWHFCCICPGTFWETCEELPYTCEESPIGEPNVCGCYLP